MDKNGLLRKVYLLLSEIEFGGPADYSIGVPTCPYCRAFCKSKYNKNGQHRDGCLLKEILDVCNNE